LKVFIDSNIPMYVAGADHPHREPARRFLQQVLQGTYQGLTSTEILQEILYRYQGLKRLDTGLRICDLFLEICTTVLPVTIDDVARARELLATVPGLSVRDALHAAVAFQNGLVHIASFDRVFDRIPGIERLELD
jgi:hypothetical protein